VFVEVDGGCGFVESVGRTKSFEEEGKQHISFARFFFFLTVEVK